MSTPDIILEAYEEKNLAAQRGSRFVRVGLFRVRHNCDAV